MPNVSTSPLTRIAVFLLATAFLTGSAVAAAQPVAEGFVGRIEGSRAFIAVLRDGSSLTAYVCEEENFGHWFRGELRNSGAELVSASGAKLTLAFGTNQAKGVFTTPEGAFHAFTADEASGEAALIRGEAQHEDTSYVAGWIVLPDGTMQGYVEQDNIRSRTRTRFDSGPVSPTNFSSTVPGDGIIAILIGKS